MTIDAWWESGERVALRFGGGEHGVFVQRLGAGEPMTLLHGFPSSSHDWSHVAPALADRYALLLPDLLGFGASDKPAEHTYSIHEQADLVEALWAAEGTTRTRLVAHDYGVSVAQELLARREEGALGVELVAVDFLNGGLYPDIHRPEPVQTALLDPVQGPQISAILDEALITGALGPTFASEAGPADHAPAIWRSLERYDGQRNAHLLIRYIVDRQEHAERWTSVLERTDVPLRFVWGMLDPISGAHMAERIRERLPSAPLVALEDVAHWPPLEAPDRVAAALLEP